MKVNFHIHTNYSDGAVNPKNMVEIMNEKHFDCIALTDHDTIDGVNETTNFCDRIGITFIPGVEITSFLDESLGLYDDSYKVHIVGLGIEPLVISSALKRVEDKKIKYHQSIMNEYISIDKLCKCDFDISNRVSCVELLYSLKLIDSIEHGMSLFKVSPYAMSIKESIQCIHQAGGISIWAHPFILPKNGGYKIKISEVEQIYSFMRNCGIDGLEAYYQEFSEEEQLVLEELSYRYGGLRSTGTDFHGDTNQEYDLLNNFGKYDENLFHVLINRL